MKISPAMIEHNKKYSIQKQNWIMACYVASLCNNETIKGILIKTGTIKDYIKAAITFSEHTRDRTHWHFNPTKDAKNNTFKPIKAMLDEHKIWEAEMNKRKEVTEEMYDYIQQQRTSDITSLENTLADWACIARQAGLRLSEYAQSETKLRRNKGKPELNKLNQVKAFTMADFTFVGPHGQEIHYDDSTHLDINTVRGGYIRWRMQKNGEKNETIPYARNNHDQSRCVIRAMLNIRRRAQLLNVPPDSPIGVAFIKGKRTFLTDTHIEKSLKTAARIVHKIKDKKKLSKYSSHSWRVMACVILYAANQSTEFIKSRLRWKSESFKMYLRHVPILGYQHNAAIPGNSFCF